MFCLAHLNEIPDRNSLDLDCYLKLLSDPEQHRWLNYSNIKKRRQFLLGRVLIRIMLSKTFQRPLTEWRLTASGPLNILNPGIPVTINLSHSEDYVLCGVIESGKLGVDIQYISESRDYMGIARSSFHEKEVQLLEHLPQRLQRQLFFRLWTLKESMIKANCLNLFGNLDCLYVHSFDTKMPLEITVKPEFSVDWTFISYMVERYAIALASDSLPQTTKLNYISLKGTMARVDKTIDFKPYIQKTIAWP